ncbi:MAG: taurine transport system substrate-binding protein [Planctomycetota bacterium]|jgi:taurine transport system substrate-binding protein
MKRFLTSLITSVVITASLLSSNLNAAKMSEITIAYFLEWPTPNQFAQLKKSYDAALGMEVNWVSFGSGNDMNAAMASGDVHIAYSQGHVPFVVGVTKGLDLTMVGVAVGYSENDNCIVRNDSGITRANAKQLEGKSVATLIGNVTHYKLLKVLAYLGVDQSKVDILPMDDGASAAAALRRGDVVMACAFGGPLRSMAAVGKPLMTGAEQEAIGLKVFDIITVPTKFMNENPEIVQTFMDVTEASNNQWRKNPEPMRATIARAAGMDQEGSDSTLERFTFPSAAEQKSAAWMGSIVPVYTKEVADFFVEQGQLDKALDSYDKFITTRFLR